LRQAADHYLRGLGGWVSIEEVELKALAVPDKSLETRKRIQEQEARLLLEQFAKKLSQSKNFYLVDEQGKSRATQDWAGQVRDWENLGISEIAICVGSSLGFAPSLKQKAKDLLGFGPQTLSHELARLVLLEQLYRAFSVLRGHPYHNEG